MSEEPVWIRQHRLFAFGAQHPMMTMCHSTGVSEGTSLEWHRARVTLRVSRRHPEGTDIQRRDT
jgi:hypothetical protein